MNAQVEQQLFAVIESEWRVKNEKYRPFGVWIRRYPPLPVEAEDVDYYSMPEAVWFLDKDGLRVDNVWKWVRYVTVQSSYISRQSVESRTFEIGFAAFAFYEDGSGCYYESRWGGLWAAGW